MANTSTTSKVVVSITWPFFIWLGGAIHVAHQPGYGFWDGVVWLYYVGRYIGANFAKLTS